MTRESTIAWKKAADEATGGNLAIRSGMPWTAAEDDAITVARRGQLVKVAAKIGRSYKAVTERRARLNEAEVWVDSIVGPKP